MKYNRVFFNIILVLFVLTLILPSTSNARVTYDGCLDFRGQPVASVHDNSINDVAIAIIENGQAVIRYNTNVLAQMSDATRQFFYVHECAHHALEHTIQNPSLQNERDADSWAINTMYNDMGLSLSRLRSIQSDISRNGRGDWTHLPGPFRAIDIEKNLKRKRIACSHRVPCQHQISCGHRMPCQHQIPCGHQKHPFDTRHPFDQDYYGNRFQCGHRINCGHREHQFDTRHQYDPGHDFDTRHQYDLKHDFDYL